MLSVPTEIAVEVVEPIGMRLSIGGDIVAVNPGDCAIVDLVEPRDARASVGLCLACWRQAWAYEFA